MKIGIQQLISLEYDYILSLKRSIVRRVASLRYFFLQVAGRETRTMPIFKPQPHKFFYYISKHTCYIHLALSPISIQHEGWDFCEKK